CPFVALQVRHQHRIAHARYLANAAEYLRRIGKLRHPLGADEAGGLGGLQAGGRETVDQCDLHLGWQQGLLVLQAVAGADFDDADVVVSVHGQVRSAKVTATRLLWLPLFSILLTRSAPTSPVRATWVPPQGCRSTPSISTRRICGRCSGGVTDMVRISSGRAASSAPLMWLMCSGASAATRRSMPALSASASSARSRPSRSKS